MMRLDPLKRSWLCPRAFTHYDFVARRHVRRLCWDDLYSVRERDADSITASVSE